MPETKRLNAKAHCPGCKTTVNPYIVEDKPQENYVRFECPTCSQKWTEPIDTGNIE